MGNEWSGLPEAKHARAGFEAALNGWCDAGNHEIHEGELVTQHPDREGFAHVECL